MAGGHVMDIDSITTYRGYTLDRFQIEAIQGIIAGESVLVSAPTGTGKTLIADYLIERTCRAGKRAVYTAPIKALSNQKFKEFKRHLGEEHVGILTGDVVIQPDAPILIMTTEIFRNLLHTDPARLEDVAYVIFDEIHYIDDPARGSVWEESLIFMPPTMRFLGLSATIPNVAELGDWVSSVQGNPVRVVYHGERAVPLEHYVYERSMGIATREQLFKRYRRRAKRLGVDSYGRIQGKTEATRHIDLVAELVPEYLPTLFFTFSRKRCEANAREAAERYDLIDDAARERIRQVIDEQLARHSFSAARRLDDIEPLLMRGIAYHHAGMLPVLKEIVEQLFEEQLIRLLYCTETFAVGLNFPCRSVCFDSVTKWDGTNFRALSNREYFQMAGRAGRRGLDEKGFVFTVVDFNFFTPNEFPSMREDEVEPLQSRFNLSYNTVIHLIDQYTPDEIRDVLDKNFASYQSRTREAELRRALARVEAEMSALAVKKTRSRGDRRWRKLGRRRNELYKALKRLPGPEAFHAEFEAKRRLLTALNYLDDDRPTARGRFAAHIHGHELLVTELYFDGVFHDWSEDELNALAASIDHEPRKGEGRPRRHPFDPAPVMRAIRLIREMELLYLGFSEIDFNDSVGHAALAWSAGKPFSEVVEMANIDEGDVVYAFRRAIDILRQVRSAAREDAALAAKLSECIRRMDRDEVSILL